ncbi:MAG: hypothetical protein V3R64_09350 [Sphingomonadales bacterium]
MLEVRLQAHYAAQWVARYGRSYLFPQNDDSHTAMLWNPSAKMFLSLSSRQGALAFDIPTLTLFWLDPRGRMGTGFSLDGKTDKEVEGLLRAMLGEVGLNPQTLKTELPYEMPAHKIGAGEAYDLKPNEKGLRSLADLYHQASGILEEVQKREEGASTVRCWPHHFDIATLIKLDDEKDPEKAKSIGVGLSPGDGTYEEPYYYITPWPYPVSSGLPQDPELFHWHTEGFTAAIIPQSMWLEENQKNFLQSGVIEAISACQVLLK